MSGHSTVLSGDDAQGNCSVYVNSCGGSEYYQTGQQTANNCTGSTLSSGKVGILDWSKSNNCLEITQQGTRAIGTVNSGGTKITLSSAGDTGLATGTPINISTQYGSNSGFGGQSNVRCANVNGEAAYLSLNY